MLVSGFRFRDSDSDPSFVLLDPLALLLSCTMVRDVRRKQLSILKAAIGTPCSIQPQLPSALQAWGPHTSGKSYIINKAIKLSGIRHVARVTGIEILCGRRAFLESIIRQLNGDADPSMKCEGLQTFVHHLKSFCSLQVELNDEKDGNNKVFGLERVLVIVDRAELIQKDHSDILHVFVNCQEVLQQRNICFILSSTQLCTSSCNNPELSTTLVPVIHFPQYTKDELIQIIVNKPPAGETVSMYQFYVNAIVTVHYGVCRDLMKLWRLVNYHHPQFVSSRRPQDDVSTLWKRLVPALRQDFKSVNSDAVVSGSLQTDISSFMVKTSSACNEMPTFSKYVLIAAFLASRNPVSFDRRLFVTERGPRKRKNTGSSLKEMKASKGPAMFPQARLQSICSKLIGKPILMDTSMYSHITTLCNSKLLVRYDDSLEDVKYRCLARLDLIREISNSLNFPLMEYLVCMP